MKQLALLVIVMLGTAMNRDAVAQDFWYVPPGYGNGYYYGLNLGYGVGFGYGIGVGVPLSSQVLMGSTTAPGPQSYQFGEGDWPATSATTSQAGQYQPLGVPSKKAKNSKVKTSKVTKISKAPIK